MRARTYDPSTAQFLSSDPLTALTWEPYSYGWDNPVNESDSTGLGVGELVIASCEDDPVACAALGAAAGTAGVIAGRQAAEEVLSAITSGEPTYESDEGEAIVKQQTEEAEQASEEKCGEESTQSLPYRGEPNSTSALDRGNGVGRSATMGRTASHFGTSTSGTTTASAILTHMTGRKVSAAQADRLVPMNSRTDTKREVVIVLSDEFAPGVPDLARGHQIWALRTAGTEKVAQQFWKEHPPLDAETGAGGITLFTGDGEPGEGFPVYPRGYRASPRYRV
jgi:hypothetical protein